MVMRAERCRVGVTYASGFPIRLSCRGKKHEIVVFQHACCLESRHRAR